MKQAAAKESKSYGFPWRLIAVGAGAYLVFVIATLPAARISGTLQKQGITLAGVSGTLWNGSAAAVQAGGISLGQVDWKVSALRLFTGTVSAELHAKRDDGYIDAVVGIGAGNKIALRDVRGSLPIAALASLGLPGGVTGWSGTLQLQLQQLTLENRWPTQIIGSVQAGNLIGPPNQPALLGSFRVEFPAPNANAASGELIGAVSSLDDSPLDAVGTLRLAATRNYQIDAQVATRPGAPASINKALQYLGEPDAQGRRPFSMAGSL